MRTSLACVVGLCAVSACSSYPKPTEHLAASMAAVRGAETAGARQVPEAELHLKLAEEQIAQAKQMMEREQNERADAMTIRAYNDARLSLSLTREAKLKRDVAQYAEAHPELSKTSKTGAAGPTLDATNPPGVDATKPEPREADAQD